jgi:uncharacterized protein (TIGR00730 family)
MNVCVYCASSERVGPPFVEVATRLGRLLGERKNNLVYGGGNTGPILALAQAAREAGGRVVSVVTKDLEDRGATFDGSDETVVARDYQERRLTMIKGSDVFVALPGGFGTLEEVAENLSMRQAELHRKPLSLVNVNGFWDNVLAFLDRQEAGGFILPEHRKLVHVGETPEESLDFLDQYAPAG